MEAMQNPLVHTRAILAAAVAVAQAKIEADRVTSGATPANLSDVILAHLDLDKTVMVLTQAVIDAEIARTSTEN